MPRPLVFAEGAFFVLGPLFYLSVQSLSPDNAKDKKQREDAAHNGKNHENESMGALGMLVSCPDPALSRGKRVW